MRPSPLFTPLKRAMDVAAAAGALLLLSPVLLLTAAAVRVGLGTPVLFVQQRPGRHGKPFHMVKFRTMRDALDTRGEPLPDGERLTRLGRFLRRTSLDELPELWNVLRGDMSLVGPRPLLMRYVPFFTPRERMRMDVPPGITGWAQVQGRNMVSWDRRLELDVWYVENRSFWLDLRILVLTVAAVFRSHGVVEDPRSVMLNLDEERARGAMASVPAERVADG